MITENELNERISSWLSRNAATATVASEILNRSATQGEISKTMTWPFEVETHQTLVSLFSAQFVRQSSQGSKSKVFFREWEEKVVGQTGLFLQVLANVCDRSIENRKLEKSQLCEQLQQFLERQANNSGIAGFVADRELKRLEANKGRYWYRCRKYGDDYLQNAIPVYFKLLGFVDELRQEPDRIEQVVHVSRVVAGDTHWLRPGNRIWQDLAVDLLDFDKTLADLGEDLSTRMRNARVINHVGIAENLTSVLAMAFGRFSLSHSGKMIDWPTEAAELQLPVWLSARHLLDTTIPTEVPLRQIITVENETSFLDLASSFMSDATTVLVYTEGHANRAVIALLRQLATSAPDAQFYHQGDLDLYGVNILNSLRQRTGIPIEPQLMDVETHRRWQADGIILNQKELAKIRKFLDSERAQTSQCVDLLQQIMETGIRVEQETFSGNLSGKQN